MPNNNKEKVAKGRYEPIRSRLPFENITYVKYIYNGMNIRRSALAIAVPKYVSYGISSRQFWLIEIKHLLIVSSVATICSLDFLLFIIKA